MNFNPYGNRFFNKEVLFKFLFLISLIAALLVLTEYGTKHIYGKFSFVYLLISFIMNFINCIKEQNKMKSIIEFYELSQYIDDLRILQLDKPFKAILKAVTGLGQFDWALLFLINNETNKFEVADSHGIDASNIKDITFKELAANSSNGTILTIQLLKKIFKTNVISEALAGSAIYYNETYFGCLVVGRHNKNKKMNEHDHFRLKVLSDQISICLHNYKMHKALSAKAEQLTFKQNQLQRELELAKIVQDNVIYKKQKDFYGLKIDSFLTPARFIGGDFLKFIPGNTKKQTAILIGDVCGKGIPAALVMAVVVSMFQNRFETTQEPSKLMTEVNLSLKEFLGAGSRFNSTAFFGIFDFEKSEFNYASAGHDFPLYFSAQNKTVTELESTGTLLGIFNESTYTANKIKINKGDKILFYTDGLTDFAEYELKANDGYEFILNLFKNKVENSQIVSELRNMVQNSKSRLKDDITVALITIE